MPPLNPDPGPGALLMGPVLEWPTWLPGYTQRPDDEYLAGKLRPMRAPPLGVIFHSGSKGADLAGYAENEPDGRAISYHFAWAPELKNLAQMVPLNLRAWHAGEWGNHWLGVALPGPYDLDPRSPQEAAAVEQLLTQLLPALPSIFYWARHSDHPSNHRRDPGPGFLDRWPESLGLIRTTPRPDWIHRIPR